MGNRLRILREQRGWTHEEAANRMGVSRGHFIKLERGERHLAEHTIRQASEAFGVEPTELFSAIEVPVVGYVAAGAIEQSFADGQGHLDMVEAPRGSSERTVAVEVRGDSLGPFFDNALIFYDEIQDPPSARLVGEVCVCGLADGRVMVKQLRRGSAPGRWTLHAQFGAPIEDVALVWAAPIRAIIPRPRVDALRPKSGRRD